MATNCVRWALYESPCDDHEDLVVLTALADHASQTGQVDIAPSIIAKRLGMPPADIGRAIRRLKAGRLLTLGERGKVAHLNLGARRGVAA
jgi:hypothetical protein